MTDWLNIALHTSEETPLASLIIFRLSMALLGGFLTSYLYRLTLGRGRRDVHSLPTTLVLLSLLIAIVTLVIGNNIARAFGLVGALSIVRFRTVVDDTADTAFVIFAVTLGMAIGAGYLVLACLAFPAVALASFIMIHYDTSRKQQAQISLVIKLALGVDAETQLKPIFDQYTLRRRVSGAGTAGKGTALEVTYQIRLNKADDILPFLSALSKIEGVMSAEIK